MSLLRSASTISVFTLISRITGLIRELLIATLFGTSAATDAFNVAFRIPNLLRRLFAEGAFSQAFIPILSATKTQQGHEATRELVMRIGSILFWILLLTCATGIIAAPYLIWLMASGLPNEGAHAATYMTRIMFPYIGFMSLCALLSGVLNTYSRFAIPAFTPVLLNLAMITSAYIGAPWLTTINVEPIYALAAGVILGGALQLGLQLWAVIRIKELQLNLRLIWRWQALKQAWHHAQTQRVLTLMLPALLGVSVAQISLLINTQIASHLAIGSVSWLSYADRLMEFPTALLGVALGVVLIPVLSAAHAKKDTEQYSQLLDWGLRLVLVLCLPCAIALGLFSKPLVATLYHYGAFTQTDALQTTRALTCYGIGLMGLVAIKVLAPGFYASQNTKTPVKIAIAILILTQILNLIFVPLLGHAGLALSIGIGALLNASCLLIGLLNRKMYRPCRGWGKLLLQLALANSALALLLHASNNHLPWLDWVTQPHGYWIRLATLLGILLLGALTYFGTLFLVGFKPKTLLRHAT